MRKRFDLGGLPYPEREELQIASSASPAMVDTNVVVYSVDSAAGDRHDRAVDIIEQLALEARLVVSAQALNEFYVVVRGQRKPPHLTHLDADRFVRNRATSAPVVPLTASVTLDALDATRILSCLSGTHSSGQRRRPSERIGSTPKISSAGA
jgi:predicted nucleic acid-binding protein